MRAFGKRMDVPGGNRGAPRQPVTILASALTLRSSRSVVLTDISPTGAKLNGRDLPSCGDDILIRVTGAPDEFGKVVWIEQDVCGITFDTPLSSATVDRLKAQGAVSVLMGVTEGKSGSTRP